MRCCTSRICRWTARLYLRRSRRHPAWAERLGQVCRRRSFCRLALQRRHTELREKVRGSQPSAFGDVHHHRIVGIPAGRGRSLPAPAQREAPLAVKLQHVARTRQRSAFDRSREDGGVIFENARDDRRRALQRPRALCGTIVPIVTRGLRPIVFGRRFVGAARDRTPAGIGRSPSRLSQGPADAGEGLVLRPPTLMRNAGELPPNQGLTVSCLPRVDSFRLFSID